MILYSQVLDEIAADPTPVDASAEAAAPVPVVVTGIPFEQPNPADARILRSLAMYLAGVHVVTT